MGYNEFKANKMKKYFFKYNFFKEKLKKKFFENKYVKRFWGNAARLEHTNVRNKNKGKKR